MDEGNEVIEGEEEEEQASDLTPEEVEESTLVESDGVTSEQFQDFLNGLDEKHNEMIELDKTQHQELLEKIESLTQTNEPSEINIPSFDYTSQLERVIELLESFTPSFDLLASSSSSILTYAVIYVPLVAFIAFGWWMLRQFMR